MLGCARRSGRDLQPRGRALGRPSRRAADRRLLAPPLRRRTRHRRQAGPRSTASRTRSSASCRRASPSWASRCRRSCPMSFAPGDNLNSHNNYFLTMVGRLRPGATAAHRRSRDLNAISRVDRRRATPRTSGTPIGVQPLQEALVGDVKAALLVLFGAVGVRAPHRLRQPGQPDAGARGRPAARDRAAHRHRRQPRARAPAAADRERAAGAACGSVLALGLAWVCRPGVNSLDPDHPPAHRGRAHRRRRCSPSRPPLAVAHRPRSSAWHPPGERSDVGPGGGAQGGRAHARATARGHRVRAALVVGEVAMSLVLLIGAGLMVKSMHGLLRVDAGFDRRATSSRSQVSLPAGRYVDEELERRFSPQAYAKARALLRRRRGEATRRLPGVTRRGRRQRPAADGRGLGQERDPVRPAVPGQPARAAAHPVPRGRRRLLPRA